MALAYGSRSAIIHHVLALTLRRAPRRPTSLSHRGLASANTAVVEGEPVSYDDQWMFPYDDIVQDVPRFKHKTAAQVRSREKRSESTPIAGPSSPINSTTWKNGSEDLKIGPLNQAQEVVAAPDETQVRLCSAMETTFYSFLCPGNLFRRSEVGRPPSRPENLRYPHPSPAAPTLLDIIRQAVRRYASCGSISPLSPPLTNLHHPAAIPTTRFTPGPPLFLPWTFFRLLDVERRIFPCVRSACRTGLR